MCLDPLLATQIVIRVATIVQEILQTPLTDVPQLTLIDGPLITQKDANPSILTSELLPEIGIVIPPILQPPFVLQPPLL